MTDRNDLDKPAAVTAFALGVLLILLSATLFAFTGGGGGGGKTWDVSWSEADADSGTGTQGANGATTTVEATAANVRTSNVTVTVDANDVRGPGGQPVFPAATCSWTLKRGTEELASGATCEVNERINVTGRPEVAEVKAGSQAAALELVWDIAGDGNETATYSVDFSWSRAASPGGLPQQGASFTASISVQVEAWQAAISERSGGTGATR